MDDNYQLDGMITLPMATWLVYMDALRDAGAYIGMTSSETRASRVVLSLGQLEHTIRSIPNLPTSAYHD